MILIVDNYDSFVHTLARYVREHGFDPVIVRNDEADAQTLVALEPRAVMLSPGPKGPGEAGVCLALLNLLPPATPLLGVCLGHQCLVAAFGGVVRRALQPMHGASSLIVHEGTGLFRGISSPSRVGRYHSLIAAPGSAGEFSIDAVSAEGEVMAVHLRDRPWFGVQFHPESVLTEAGRRMIANFLRLPEACGPVAGEAL